MLQCRNIVQLSSAFVAITQSVRAFCSLLLEARCVHWDKVAHVGHFFPYLDKITATN